MSGGQDTQAPATPGEPFAASTALHLPATEATPPPSRFEPAGGPAPGVPNGTLIGAYRSDSKRAKSVYRRANPWYRRLARGVVGLGFLVAGGAALYFGALELQDYLNRDRLPEAGVDVPAYRSTTFQISAMPPSPELDGTLELDVTTRAFRFVGTVAGEPIEVVSLDGSQVFRLSDGGWDATAPTDPSAAAVTQAIPFLVDVDSADDILVNRMRNGYVELVDKTTEGTGIDARDRYEMLFDFRAYNAAQPLQWQAFQQQVVPGITDLPASSLTIWLDGDGMLVRMLDPQTNWAWERLGHSTDALDLDPTGQIAAAGAA
jgi:hypothetical protein